MFCFNSFGNTRVVNNQIVNIKVTETGQLFLLLRMFSSLLFNAALTRLVSRIKIALLQKIQWKQHHILYV
jgi:hypothetical protein